MNTKSFILGGSITFLILLFSGIVFSNITIGPNTIDVPDDKVALYFIMDNDLGVELKNALCHNYKYKEYLDINENGTLTINPESCQDFAHRKIKQYLRDNVISYRKQLVLQNESLNVVSSID